MNLDWNMPYRSNRSPIIASNLVATSQPLAVQAGLATLKAGGNAVDAAITAAVTLTVVEPNNNGIGSDALAIVWDGKRLHGLNASGRSPAALSADRFRGLTMMPVTGWDTVTVPGAVSAWVALSGKFGSLPFGKLFEPAIHYATEGFPVGPKTGPFWRRAADSFKAFGPFMKTFTKDGRPPDIGETMVLPDHAGTLAEIADTRGESFYRGSLAEKMVADAERCGGAMTMDDLANHRADWVELLSMDAFGVSLHEIPPNSQGLMALMALGIAKHLGIEEMYPDSADSLHLQIEATRIAFAEIDRHLADIDHMRHTPAEFLDPGYLAARAAEVSPVRANPRPLAMGEGSDTVYLTTADSDGMMVSMIQSNYMGFGSGIVIPGTGISMQNRGAGFVLEAGHANQVAGGKRPYHTIIPGFVTGAGAPLMSFGVMGGHMQAQGHLQMIVRVCLHGQNPQAASDAPRWHLLPDGRLALEGGFGESVIKDLASRGHDMVLGRPEYLFGGAQLIYRLRNGYCGGSDHRKEGLVAGF